MAEKKFSNTKVTANCSNALQYLYKIKQNPLLFIMVLFQSQITPVYVLTLGHSQDVKLYVGKCNIILSKYHKCIK